MNLYLLRHASAGTRRLNPALDVKRPLDKEGKQQCLQLAHVLNALKVSFDLVISSPLKRSLQTAQLVATETGYFADFQRVLQQANGSETVLVVGHSPNLQMFLGSLLIPPATASSAKSVPQVRMRKGTIARVSIGRGPAVLLALLEPRVVRSLYATSTTKSRPKTSRK